MIVAAIALIVIYLTLYYLFGFAAFYVAGARRPCNPVWVGMLVYAILFFIEAIPMKIVQMPLRIVGVIWLITVLGLVGLILFYLHAEIYGELKKFALTVWENKWTALMVGGVVIAALAWTESQAKVGSPWDSAYYVGEVTTSVYEGTMEITDPINGIALSSFNVLYMLETYLMHSAVVCTLTGIPALIEVRIVMIAVMTIVFFALIWDIGKTLFGKDYWKAAVLMGVVFLISLFSASMFWPGQFLLTRCFEGKSILANIMIPAVFYSCMNLWDRESRGGWMCLFLTMMSSFTYSMSSIFIMPVVLAGYGVVLLCRRRNWHVVLNLAICLLPCLITAVIYVLMSKDIIKVIVC